MPSRFYPQLPGRRGLLLACCLLSISLSAAVAEARSNSERVNQVKAAFILNIARFVSWPLQAGADSTHFMLCYYREDPLGSGVELMLNKRIDGLDIKRMLIEQPQQRSDCRLLLIPSAQLEHYISALATDDARQPVLTIADLTDQEGQGVAYPGVVMNLVRREVNIGFEVNRTELARHGLTMSSDLLKLARLIGPAGGEP